MTNVNRVLQQISSYFDISGLILAPVHSLVLIQPVIKSLLTLMAGRGIWRFVFKVIKVEILIYSHCFDCNCNRHIHFCGLLVHYACWKLFDMMCSCTFKGKYRFLCIFWEGFDGFLVILTSVLQYGTRYADDNQSVMEGTLKWLFIVRMAFVPHECTSFHIQSSYRCMAVPLCVFFYDIQVSSSLESPFRT